MSQSDNTWAYVAAGVAVAAAAIGGLVWLGSQAPPTTEEEGTVDIVVTSQSTGNPIQGAQVTVGTQSGYTNSQGVFTAQLPAGSYSVSVSASGYSPYSGTVTVTAGQVTTLPVALTTVTTVTPTPLSASISATPTSGQAPLTVQFTSQVSGGVPPYSYEWDFGDGQTSTSANPSHTYYAAGTYQASLAVTDSAGNTVTSNTVTITVTAATVTSQPLSVSATASPTSGYAPLTVQFTASPSGGVPPYSYYWQFGDGYTSTQQNPTHTYQNAGVYQAQVTVTDSQGNTANATVPVSVATQVSPLSVHASASPTSGYAPLTVQFTGSASGGVPPYSYYWQFGDGQSSTEQNPVHAYEQAGKYTAIFTVTDSKGNTAQSNVIITVYSPTEVYYSHTWTAEGLKSGDMATLVVNGQPYTLYAGGSVTVNNLYGNVQWVVGPSVDGAEPSPSSGTVSGSGTTYITFTYLRPVQAFISASPTSGLAPLKVTFTLGADGGSGSYMYSLDFGDNTAGYASGITSATSLTVTHTYQSVGKFVAKLTVQDVKTLQTASAQVTIGVSAPPGAIVVTFVEQGLPDYNIIGGKPSTPVGWSITIGGEVYSAQAGKPITVTLNKPASWSASTVRVFENTRYLTYYPHPASGTVSSSSTVTIQYSTVS